MFDAVKKMNTAFGNPEGNPNDFLPLQMDETPVTTVKAWGRLEKQCKNIQSEYNELMKAVQDQDLEETRDALCDLLVFTLGAYHFLGINAEKDMEAVIAGVMTRFCKDEDDLRATKHKYDLANVQYYEEGVFPTVCLKSAKDQDMYGADGQVIDHLPKGKFLKSVSMKTAVFPAII